MEEPLDLNLRRHHSRRTICYQDFAIAVASERCPMKLPPRGFGGTVSRPRDGFSTSFASHLDGSETQSSGRTDAGGCRPEESVSRLECRD